MAHICLHTHFVFSTKDREPQIKPEWQERLYAYIGGIVRVKKCRLIAAGGMEDHVHLLVGMHQSVAPADLVRDVKASSSGWVHDELKEPFEWQTKYGAFAVSKSGLDAVVQYINTQAEHHKRMTFQEEYLEFLKRHGIEYDPRYVFE
jgi:putative transposase